MGVNDKLKGILSLSAASMALLQNGNSAGRGTADGVQPEQLGVPHIQIISKTEKLVLAPAHQAELLKMYADHSSHASHASHSSHVSGSSDSDTPYYYAPPAPAANPAPAPPVSAAPKTAVGTNVVAATTNAMGSTNVISAANVAHIKSLKVDAARGSAYAQYTLGVCYLNGSDGVPQSMERAKMMLELSAAQGNPGAVDRLDELKREETNTPPVVK